MAWRIFIVETFLKAAYLYDDGRLLPDLNFSGENGKVTLQLAERAVSDGEALCSNFAPSGAAWHKSGTLKIFPNIEFTFILPYMPEMNPIERIWKELRAGGFHNEAFHILYDVIAVGSFAALRIPIQRRRRSV